MDTSFLSKRFAVLFIAVALGAGFILAGCGGSDDDSTDTNGGGETQTNESGTDTGSSGGAPEGLVRGTNNGMIITYNNGGFNLQLNDEASDSLRSQVQGATVEVKCGEVTGTGQWAQDTNAATLLAEGDADSIDECTVYESDTPLATATMAPVGQ